MSLTTGVHKRVLVLGLGIGAIPATLRAVRPDMEIDVVEIDAVWGGGGSKAQGWMCMWDHYHGFGLQRLVPKHIQEWPHRGSMFSRGLKHTATSCDEQQCR